ncbi:MAG TPA: hypothetical protein VFY46_03325 [Acidimicrobiia bacterium]|nr:hypothetical protein [Acidimicrobiia bacterium]
MRVTVEPLCALTVTQRRQLDDEIELMGVLMVAKPSLTIGPVSVGPHP